MFGSLPAAAQLMMSFLDQVHREIGDKVQDTGFESELAGQLSHRDPCRLTSPEEQELEGNIQVGSVVHVESILARLGVHADVRQAVLGAADREGKVSLRDLQGILGRENGRGQNLEKSGRVDGQSVRDLFQNMKLPVSSLATHAALEQASSESSYDVRGLQRVLSSLTAGLADRQSVEEPGRPRLEVQGAEPSRRLDVKNTDRESVSPHTSKPRFETMIPSFSDIEGKGDDDGTWFPTPDERIPTPPSNETAEKFDGRRSSTKSESNASGVPIREHGKPAFSGTTISALDAREGAAMELEGGAEPLAFPSRGRMGDGGWSTSNLEFPDSQNSTLPVRPSSPESKISEGERASGAGVSSAGATEKQLPQPRPSLPGDTPEVPEDETLPRNATGREPGFLSALTEGRRILKAGAVEGALLSKRIDANAELEMVRFTPEQEAGGGASGSDTFHKGSEGDSLFPSSERSASTTSASETQPPFSAVASGEKGMPGPSEKHVSATRPDGAAHNWEEESADPGVRQRDFLKLELSDKRLGRLQLEVEARHQEVAARLTAETEQARSLILQNAASLRHELQTQGLVLGQFQVDVHGQGNRRGSQNREKNSRTIKGEAIGVKGEGTQPSRSFASARSPGDLSEGISLIA